MIKPSDVAILQQRYGLTYHVPYALQAQQTVGFAGRKVIEVGGSLPEAFVLGELGASQWIAVEEPGYWAEIAQDKAWREARPIAGVRRDDLQAPYAILTGRIENAPSDLDGQFDMAFSIAAFEHMDRFPQSLEAIHRILKPGGVLFSIFSPIWSAPDGHHLPHIPDASGRPFDPQLIPRWGHLLMRPPALYAHLCTLTTPRTAAEVVHFVYNSPHINRLFAEDYIDYVRMSRFEVDTLSIAFPSPIEAGVQTKLEALYPGRRLFSTHGMMMVLRRRE